MESINSEKWRVRLAIVAIFLLGFVAGGLAVNLYSHSKAAEPPQARGPSGLHRGPGGFEAVFKNLNLSDQQQQEVNQILADTRQRLEEVHRASRPQMDDIKNQTKERLKTVLTVDQWNQFQQQIKERESRMDRTSDRPHRRSFFQDPQESPSPQQ